jgi:hypothetical protein
VYWNCRLHNSLPWEMGVCCIVPECPSRLEGIWALMSIAKTRLCGADGFSVSQSLRNSELSSASQAACRHVTIFWLSPVLLQRGHDQRSALRETCAAKSFLSNVVQPHSPPNSCSRASSPCLHCSLRPVFSCHLSAHRNKAFRLRASMSLLD